MKGNSPVGMGDRGYINIYVDVLFMSVQFTNSFKNIRVPTFQQSFSLFAYFHITIAGVLCSNWSCFLGCFRYLIEIHSYLNAGYQMSPNLRRRIDSRNTRRSYSMFFFGAKYSVNFSSVLSYSDSSPVSENSSNIVSSFGPARYNNRVRLVVTVNRLTLKS